MKERIFLLPGFGEDHRAFRNLAPYLRDKFNLIHVDYRPLLRRMNHLEVDQQLLATNLVEYYNIHPDDRLIGHSMGGFFSYNIAAHQGNPVAMLGAFSDSNKIIRMTESKPINYSMVASGILKTPVMRFYISQRGRQGRVKDEMLDVQRNFKSFSNDDLVKMLTLSYSEMPPPALREPLRIHALDDTVIRPPDEPFHQVKGGHFSLIFHPEQVYEGMEDWLRQS